MAGDRIFMRTDLDADPRVRRLAHRLRTDVHGCALDVRMVIGLLWQFWSLADSLTEDGVIKYESAETLDAKIYPDFTAAMAEIGWLEVLDDAVRVPRFLEYNGKSAKRRLRNAQRMHSSRTNGAQDAHTLRTESAHDAHGPRTKKTHRGHKKDTLGTPASASALEDNTPSSRPNRDEALAGFAEFWTAYPRKVDKGDAEKAWAKLRPDAALRERILAGVVQQSPGMAAKIAAGEREYVPHPASWLHKRRWEVDPAEFTPAAAAGPDRRFTC